MKLLISLLCTIPKAVSFLDIVDATEEQGGSVQGSLWGARRLLRMGEEESVSKEERRSGDYCFVCKDGGHLRLCDHKDCTRSYHPECVNKAPTFLDADESWTCGWHSCLNCCKRSTFKCFCCPTSFCCQCVRKAEFSQVKGTKGFCGECLRLAKLVEECADVDSDEEKVDFDDRDTWEFLFKDYWPIVKQEEGLTLENVLYADALLNKVEKCKDYSDPDESSEQMLDGCESEDTCDDECSPFMTLKWKKERKRSWRKKSKSNKNKFVGWGSVELEEFLASLGKETKDPIEKFDVYEIVRNYVLSNNLLHQDKRSRKYVISDSALYSVVRRRKFKLSRLYTLLEKHFSSSDGSLDEFSSPEEDASANSGKKKRMTRCDSKIKPERHHHKEIFFGPPRSCLAAITSNNIKAVYLKRSLIVEFMGDPDTFETKIVGCFVRVKVDPKGLRGTPWKLYQLGQVVAVKKVPQEYKLRDISTDVVLCISNISEEVKIFMLSDDDFEEEECKDLHQLVETGLIKRPSVVELEKKIIIVHSEIVKHSIKKELMKLEKLIERANEKGWRKDLYEYIDRKKVLSKPEEVTRLVKNLPKIMADPLAFEEVIYVGESEESLAALPTKLGACPYNEKVSSEVCGESNSQGETIKQELLIQ